MKKVAEIKKQSNYRKLAVFNECCLRCKFGMFKGAVFKRTCTANKKNFVVFDDMVCDKFDYKDFTSQSERK